MSKRHKYSLDPSDKLAVLFLQIFERNGYSVSNLERILAEMLEHLKKEE